MLIRELSVNERPAYKQFTSHLMQSWEWGETKEAMGKEVHRYGQFNDFGTMLGGYQISIHPLPAPLSNWKIGYLPKCPPLTVELTRSLLEFGRNRGIIFFKVEPNEYISCADPTAIADLSQKRTALLQEIPELRLGKELFTRYNFIIDLTLSEEALLARMHPKTRYNINLAQRKGVQIAFRNDDEAFQIFLDRYFETTKRNGFHGHDTNYHRNVWNVFKKYNMAQILISTYNNTPLTVWMLVTSDNTLYYPYGGSTTLYREVMASNLVAWEAIKYGKSQNLQKFDLWGALGPDAVTTDPYYGFHRFKSGYGGDHLEYLGSFDLVVNPQQYQLFLQIQKLRDKFLKFKSNIVKYF
ncbi:MAG: peptidoglycan bridge formation protein FemAB [Patescibacteria group bacterium]|nr:MAG: peptidoglycan bridge formation protein FemAB [Patescibacteria group bacterium]